MKYSSFSKIIHFSSSGLNFQELLQVFDILEFFLWYILLSGSNPVQG